MEDLKTDVAVEKVCLEVVGEVRTPAAAQKGARAVDRVEARAKEQDEKDKVKCKTQER